MVNVSGDKRTVVVELADVLVKLRIPRGAFRLDHIYTPPEGSNFDYNMGVLTAELPPNSFALFRMKQVQRVHTSIPRAQRPSTSILVRTLIKHHHRTKPF